MRRQAERAQLIEELKRQLRAIPQGDREPVSSGPEALHSLLPEGFRRGTIVEWLADGEGAGAETLALMAGARLRSSGGLVIVDPESEFYPPAAAALGWNLEETILVRPRNAGDALWALEQVLRCSGVSVVLGRLEGIHNRGLQRLQRAAETGGTIGFLIRPAAVRSLPSWADVRLLVTPLPSDGPSGRRLRVEVIRGRKGTDGRTVGVEICHETGLVRSLPSLAPATALERAAGA